ncbi:MAG TPA: outer membrane beta-barrel protein [Candidatus Omnitrophota bacterium]|nr:outer membrane beta-barrel protein [Candidatus Omnitrophota bacterium]
MQHRIGFEGDYTVSSHTTLLAMYDFYYRDFDPGTSATINGLTAGARQFFTEHTYADASFGYDFINSFNNKDYIKPRVSLRLTDDFDPATRASVSFDKRSYTNASTQDLFNYWQTALSFSRRLFDRLGFNASGFYGKGRYMVYNIKDTLKGVSAGFAYDISHNVTGTLNYSYSKTTSNDPGREYEKNTVSAGITAVF